MQSNDELQALKRFVIAHQGQFAVAFVRMNDPLEAKHLMEELAPELAVEGIVARILDYSSHRTPSLFDDLCSRVSDQPDAIVISGLERNIVDVEDDRDRTWARVLNQQRELFRGHFHCPLIICLTDYAADKLFEEAPDFADWHAAIFRLGPPISIQSFDGPAPQMPDGARAQRIELLETRRVELLKASKPNQKRLAQVYRELGALYGSSESNLRRQAGIGLLKEAAKLFEQQRATKALAETFFELGNVFYWLKEWNDSDKSFARAHELASEVKDERLARLAATGMGFAQRGIDLYASDRYFRNTLHRLRELGDDRRGEAHLLRFLGQNASLHGDLNEALHLYKKAQEIYKEIHDESGEGNVLRFRAMIHMVRNEWRRAQRLLEQARIKFQAVGDVSGIKDVLADLERMKAPHDEAGNKSAIVH